MRFRLALQLGQRISVASFLNSEKDGFGRSTLRGSVLLENGGASNSRLQDGHRNMAALYAFRQLAQENGSGLVSIQM